MFWSWCSSPGCSGPGALTLVLWRPGCLAAHIPSLTPITCRHDGAQFLGVEPPGQTVQQVVQRERTPTPPRRPISRPSTPGGLEG